jgi:hypothetical protein
VSGPCVRAGGPRDEETAICGHVLRGARTALALLYRSSHLTTSSGDTLLLERSM